MKFNFALLTHSPERINVQTAKLGDPDAISAFTDDDVGKPMVMGNQGNFDIAADGDNIEGFLDNIDAGPTMDGMTIGGVARGDRSFRVKVWVSGSASVLDYVVAGTNTAAGTASTHGLGVVKAAGDDGGTPPKVIVTQWRIIAFLSDAKTGVDEAAIIERV